ncbi:chromosome segregation protein SMC [Alsobacter soli]|uniref:Chromosome partition protein Smc n=1 Tax=Alsobacter soli TaxID=2109933 RepID=A0A2T1HSN6_9HYPH|nr:chromosome segregation protein SMC [Alsobacter soli]PSC04673.1 chromosome segregation protein SMC [Alsobacter soli]
MKLTRLRLVGFKTFVEPTEFLIEPGLTGVVGPNGCGKSNLVEALRWVMGESSFKSLRASGMDDVIFSGSGNRPSRNTAEVALLVDNGSRTAPAAFNDADLLDVSRRIEREAGSTYRINGREVRARDVQLLFADAATGARSPAMVRQGQIGEIIAAKPQARRRILEDAAGIAGLHSRRHEAEMRLRSAEENLLRVEDVLQQIDGQVDSLKRQARQASRYRTVAADIRRLEALLLYIGWREARDAVAAAERKVEEDLRLVAERTTAQGQAARDQAVAAHAVPALRDAEAAAAAALQRLLLARDNLDAEEKRAGERAVELERRAFELTRDLQRERALVDDAAAALERLAAEEEGLDEDFGDAAEQQAEARERLAELEDVLFDSEAALAAAQSALADRNARRAAAERAIKEAEERVARLSREAERVGRDLAALDVSLGGDADLEALEAEMEQVAESYAEAEDRAQAAREAHADARERRDRLRGPAQEADRKAQRLETEARTLEKMLAADAGKAWPRALDGLTAERGFETALGAALGDDLDASVDPAAPAHWADTGAGEADPALPAGCSPLSDHVEGPPALTRRLRQIGVVSREDGLRLRAELRPGQRLVSREGDLWRWDGFTTAAEAPTPAARRLAERARLSDLKAEAEAAREAAESLRHEGDLAEAAVRAAAQDETLSFETVQMMRRGLDAVRERLAAAQRRRGEVAAKRSALAEAHSRLSAEAEEAEARREHLAQQLALMPGAPELEAALDKAKARAAQDRQAANEARILVQTMQREVEMRARRRQAIAAERQAWTERRTRAAGQIDEVERRQAELEDERETLRDAPELFLEKRRQILTQIAEAENARKAAGDRLAEAAQAQSAADRVAQEALAALAAAREEKVRSESRLEAARDRFSELVRAVAERLEVTPDRLPELSGVAPGAELPDAASVERRLESLRGDRERLGAVNLRAEEELAAVEQQRDSLSSERDDLTEAIKRLRTAIQSLNKEGRERLLSAFEVVQGHFERLFTSLFGGGTAQLELIESDDPLEAGLEIVARPPGKKPQTMTLLSGGEQALTAIALIFAVFLTNPSPICVLDEVDAPLDDSNVERYCDLLREMAQSTETRFLVITHNPITMARMDRLFGVTMAERGVSQLVSVDLGVAERLVAEAV